MRRTLGSIGRRAGLGLLTLGFLIVGTADAGADAKRKALSRTSFERAELLYRQSKFEQALKAYNEAMSHFRYPAYLFNIAQCHRQLKRYVKARFYYRLFLSEASNPPNKAEVERFIAAMGQKIAEEARRERSKGRVSVVSDPPGAEVFVNDVKGKPRGRTPMVLRLSPGQHLVLVRAKGYQTVQRAVTVRTGAVVPLDLRLEKPRPRSRGLVGGPAVKPQKPGQPYYLRWWFWTGLSVSLAAVGAATYTGVETLRLRKIWDDNQGAPADDPNLLTRAKTLRTVTDVLIGVAAVSAGAAIIGAIVVAARNKRAREKAVIVPSCGPTGCGLWVRGRF